MTKSHAKPLTDLYVYVCFDCWREVRGTAESAVVQAREPRCHTCGGRLHLKETLRVEEQEALAQERGESAPLKGGLFDALP